MKLSKALGLLCAAASVAAAAPAFAQPHELMEFIKEFDANKDGAATYEEYRAIRDARFAAGDKDKNGAFNEDEYVGEYVGRLDAKLAASTAPADQKAKEREAQVKQAHVRFGVLDRDGDNKITWDEFLAMGEKSFWEKDTNKDKKVTANDPPAAEE